MTFTYCISAVSNQVSQLMCYDPAVALSELQVLVKSCNATLEPITSCTDLAKAASYGVCGNRPACVLRYNGPIDTCFNEALNQTVASCVSPTTAPATSSLLPLAIILPLAGATAVVGFLCWRYRSKITELWNRCCHGGYQKL